MSGYVLDTGILLGYLRGAAYASYVEKKYAPFDAPNLALISVVSMGELQSLAHQFAWGEKKVKALRALLSRLPSVPLMEDQPTTIERYAEIDAYSQGKLQGHPLPSGVSARNMGKNDLWIAATASVVRATLLTTDKDFDHLDGVYLDVLWIGPTLSPIDVSDLS